MSTSRSCKKSFTHSGNILAVMLLLLMLGIGCGKHQYDAMREGRMSSLLFNSPKVLQATPSNSDTGVALEAALVIKFDKPLDEAAKKALRVSLRRDDSVSWGNITFQDSIATFAPEFELKPNSVYVATVSFGDSSATGLTETSKYILKFVTKGPPIYAMERRTDSVSQFNRDGSKLMQVGNYLYCYGGWSRAPDSYNDIYRSSGDLSVWEQLPNAPWHRRHTFGIGKIDSTVYIFGGDHLYDEFDVWRTNDGENFEQVSESLDATVGRRLLYGATVHNNKLLVLGGQKALTNDSYLSDVWVSDDGANWSQIADDKEFLGKNITGAVASFNGKLWVVGGGKYEHADLSQRWTNHVYSSEDGVNWMRERDAPWSGRQYHDVCVWDNKLWMVGGNNGENLSDIWYMKADGEWVNVQTPADFQPRHATALAEYNNQLVLVCGNYHNDCWVIERVY